MCDIWGDTLELPSRQSIPEDVDIFRKQIATHTVTCPDQAENFR